MNPDLSLCQAAALPQQGQQRKGGQVRRQPPLLQYGAQAGQPGPGPDMGGANFGGGQAGGNDAGPDVVDADYTVVDDDNK